MIATDPDEIRRLQQGLVIPPAQGVIPVKPPLTGTVEFPPPSGERVPPIDTTVAPDDPTGLITQNRDILKTEPIRGGGKYGKALASLHTTT